EGQEEQGYWLELAAGGGDAVLEGELEVVLTQEAGLGVAHGARGDRLGGLVEDGGRLEGLPLGEEGVLELEDLTAQVLGGAVVLAQAGGDGHTQPGSGQ